MAKSIIEKINDYLLESETFANEFLPLKETLTPIQVDFQKALSELKEKSANADDLADKVFYLNRYTDLVRKVESVFDIRSKRLQQTIAMLNKLPSVSTDDNTDNTEVNSLNTETETKQLTPEQANEIMMILRDTKK